MRNTASGALAAVMQPIVLPTLFGAPVVLPTKRRVWPNKSTTCGLAEVGGVGSAAIDAESSSQTNGARPHELAVSIQRPSCERIREPMFSG
jgi:hypothetical protein